ncbi:uridine kinase [Mesonia aquimarina]|uniref:uridine kinase n=1 Tax=Mesonia aquimarina TaxID=1504967 RepID=UPI0021D24AD1|nr:uridine kinase [Mesonia aquimarina]
MSKRRRRTSSLKSLLLTKNKMLIIGIAGGTGSGKTSLVKKILDSLNSNEINLISQDSYYKENNKLSQKERAQINFDHPDAIDFELLTTHLKELKTGKTIAQPTYSFIEHNRMAATQKIEPKKIILVEGILIFNHQELRDLFDVKIFVDADTDERLIRRLKRDIKERGRNLEEVLTRYQNTLKPMHQQFIEPSKAFADIIIPNNHYNSTAVNIVQAIIKNGLD